MKILIQLVDDEGNIYAGEATLQLASGEGDTKIAAAPNGDTKSSGKVSCTSAIERLWKGEKFKQKLSFVDVNSALSAEGFTFPRNTVMMALQSAGFLTKQGSRGNYTWTQKYPSNN